MRKKLGRIIVFLFLGFSFMALAQGCVPESRKCGCGSDLMNAYRKGRRR